MSAKGLLALGAYSGLMTAIIAAVGSLDGVQVVFISFASGMVFGKGYGIWEERSRRTPNSRGAP